MQTVRRVKDSNRLNYWCCGCKQVHGVTFGPGGWDWNGDVAMPTFIPSVHVNPPGQFFNPGQPTCHTFVKDGLVTFLGDCTHDLAGQTVPLPDITDGFPFDSE